MWILQRISDETVLHKLIVGKTYTIGRKSSEADIVVPNDASVSRKHATLTVNHPIENLKDVSKKSFITIKDSSKYGTFHMTNSELKLSSGSTKQFYHGDKVRFGGQNSVYRLLYSSLVVTTSMVDKQTKDKVCKTIYTLAGHYANQWNDAITHVAMSSIKLSFKVIQALINGSHIVTPDYLYALLENISTNTDVNCSNFLPKLDEPSLSVSVSEFDVKPQRKTLFANKTFIFLNTKQMNKFKPALEAANGTVLLITEVPKSRLTEANNCIIDCGKDIDESVANEEQIRQHKRNINLKHMRFIQEHEIGLSVVHCCTDVYCNSCFDLTTQSMFTQNSLASENSVQPTTEDIASNSVIKRSVSKRTRSSNNEEVVVEKRQKVEASKSSNISSPETKMETNDEVQNSCLEDDSLWSQNIPDEEERGKHGKVIPETPAPKAIINSTASMEVEIKNEPVTPNLKSAFRRPAAFVPRSNGANHAPKIQTNKTNELEMEPEPIAKMQVTVQSLIIKKKEFQEINEIDGIKVKNFKKFRKVFPTYMQKNLPESHLLSENNYSVPPKIIGGSDLIICSNNNMQSGKRDAAGDIYEWMNENQSIQESQDSNPFMDL